MNEHSITNHPLTRISPDDPTRPRTVALPETGQSLPHIGLQGDT